MSHGRFLPVLYRREQGMKKLRIIAIFILSVSTGCASTVTATKNYVSVQRAPLNNETVTVTFARTFKPWGEGEKMFVVDQGLRMNPNGLYGQINCKTDNSSLCFFHPSVIDPNVLDEPRWWAWVKDGIPFWGGSTGKTRVIIYGMGPQLHSPDYETVYDFILEGKTSTDREMDRYTYRKESDRWVVSESCRVRAWAIKVVGIVSKDEPLTWKRQPGEGVVGLIAKGMTARYYETQKMLFEAGKSYEIKFSYKSPFELVPQFEVKVVP
jgi:hypothetical protein